MAGGGEVREEVATCCTARLVNLHVIGSAISLKKWWNKADKFNGFFFAVDVFRIEPVEYDSRHLFDPSNIMVGANSRQHAIIIFNICKGIARGYTAWANAEEEHSS